MSAHSIAQMHNLINILNNQYCNRTLNNAGLAMGLLCSYYRALMGNSKSDDYEASFNACLVITVWLYNTVVRQWVSRSEGRGINSHPLDCQLWP